jgi:hypothetical protein
MAQLSAADAFSIGKQLLDAHDVVHDYFVDNWGKLSPADRDRLQSVAITLYQNASDVISHGVGAVIDDLQASVAGITGVTGKVENALKTIKDVKKVIEVATALVGLAAAIPTGNIGTIVAAGKQLTAAAGVQGDLKKG